VRWVVATIGTVLAILVVDAARASARSAADDGLCAFGGRVAPCAAVQLTWAGSHWVVVGPFTPPKVPIGVFKTTITDADLRAGGVTDISENHGTYTLKLLPKGRWTFHQVARNSLQNPDHAGTYSTGKNGVTFTDTGFDVAFTARLSFDGKRLRFRILRADLPELRVIFGAHPWAKVRG